MTPLTLQQRAVVGMRADRMPVKTIARELGISTHTVYSHIKNARIALGIASSHGLTAWVWQQRGRA